jgi:tetratricopeptide (TPR) repeat protein
MRRFLLPCVLLALGLVAGDAHAVPMRFEIARCTPYNAAIEAEDSSVLRAAEEAAHRGGLMELRPLLSKMETALAHAPAALDPLQLCDGRLVVRANNPSVFAAASALLADKAQSARIWKGKAAPKGVDWRPAPYVNLSFLVGAIYSDQGDFEIALAALNKGLALDPANAVIANAAAQVMMSLHRPDDAVALCDRLLNGPTPLGETHKALLLRTRGAALGESGRFDEAIQDYRNALTHDPAKGASDGEIANLERLKAGSADGVATTFGADQIKQIGPRSTQVVPDAPPKP